MTGEGIKKKRDPIFSACFVVFIVACVGVLGVYVDEHYLQQDDTIAAYGDTVEVNYTGSYYAYYDEDGAVVFDTTFSSIGDGDSYDKANEFSSGSYSTIDVTIGDGDYLSAFENCLVGHKVGDTIQIAIPVGEGYVAPSGSMYESSTTYTVPRVQTMTKAQFDDLYDIDLNGSVTQIITTAYGWDASVSYNTTNNTVTITNMPKAGETYEYTGNEDSQYGQVSFAVQSIGKDDITVTIEITDYTEVDDGIQMIALNVDGSTIYITDYDGSTFSYKTCAERYNVTLYFVIEIVSIN